MKRRALPMISFPAGDGAFSTFCLSVRVYHTERVELQGFIRMPYSNRPKEGGGIAVPSRALNAKFSELPQGRVFSDLKWGVRRKIREAKTYKPKALREIQPKQLGTGATRP
jgi:hypothetical protein